MLRNVRVYNHSGKLLHTYPIDYDFMGDQPDDRDFIAEAMKAAREDKLVNSEEDLRMLRFEVLGG